MQTETQVDTQADRQLVHGPDVRGKEVIHLVSKGCLTEQPAASHQAADGDVEVVVSRAPVADLGERVH